MEVGKGEAPRGERVSGRGLKGRLRGLRTIGGGFVNWQGKWVSVVVKLL